MSRSLGAPDRPTEPRWIPLLLAAGALAYLLPLRPYGLSLNDDGWWMQPVLRMRGGEVLYRDVWTFYAPGIHHVLEWLFAITGPSLLAARTLFALLIAATVALAYRLARRFAPPSLAWLPAAVYGLVPGPWHKAYYGTSTAAIFLVLARALERPRAARFSLAGAVAGLGLVTRQDLGLAAIGLTLAAAVLPALAATPFAGARDPRLAARLALATLGGFAAPVALVAAWYAAHGALGDLVVATLVRAFGQMGAHPPALSRLLAPQSFGLAPEGRGVGTLMLLPLVLYPVVALLLLRRLRSEGLTAPNLLVAALLAFACATLAQAYYPMLLLRFLQSALPFYLLAGFALAETTRRLSARGWLPLARAAVGAAVGLAGLHVGLVIFGLPAVPQPLYTGSARVLRYAQPVAVGGETIFESFAASEEIRLVRAFYAAHAAAGEPTLALPAHALYNVLLERPNPTRFLADHPLGNFTMTAAQKRVEAGRLLASGTRFAIADQRWYARGGTPDPLLEMLRCDFHPVRGYGTVLVLERGGGAEWARFGERLRRAIAGGPVGAAGWRALAALHPDEPLAWRMLGLALQAAGEPAGAVDALHRAAELDPADVVPLETTAALLAGQGRRAAAVADLRRARAVRDSGEIRRLARELGVALE